MDYYNAASYFCKNFENPANADKQAVVRGNLAKNTYWPEYGKNSADNSIIRCNVSEKAVDCNATKGNLPTKANPVYAGETYRFNLQVSEDKKLSKAELYIKPVGGEFGKKFTYTPTGNATYFRYCDYKYAFENKTGKVEYYWKLFHTDGAKEELDKKTVSVTRPGTPTDVMATIKDTKTIKLTWAKVADAETYTVKWRVASSDQDNWKYEKGVTGTSYTFDTLEAGHRYTFRVIAHRGKAESEESKKAVTVTFNNAPKITRVSDTSLKLEWDYPQNAKSYAIWRKKHDGSYKEIVSGVTKREYTDTGLKAGTRYYYYVVATCATDNATYPDCVSEKAAYSTYISAPKLTAQGQNSVKLEWKQNDSDATYSDFEIYRKIADQGSFEKIKSLKWSATSYTDTGLADGTAYEYYVKAVGEKGSVPSLSAKAATDAKPTYYLDVNGYLDEQNNGKLTNYGTMDVYIDGKSVADNADDYYRQWSSGTKYEIKDIRPTGEHAFVGVKSGALSGTINSATTVVLEFASVYVVRYDANGGTGAPPNQTKQFGKDLTLSAQIPSRDGYAFAGWSDAPDGDVLYQPGGVYKENASITLYAVWRSLNSAQLVVGSQSASPGGQVTVPVSLKSNPGVVGFSFAIEYDAEKLEYLGAADGNFSGISDNVSAEGNQLGFAYSSASDANLYGETIVKLTFQVKNGAKGMAKLRIVMDEDFGDSFRAFNSETQTIAPVNVDTQDGEITIADLIPGDVDGSGKVDNDDLILLTRYRARWKVTLLPGKVSIR